MTKKKKSKNELSNEKRHAIHSENGRLLLKRPTSEELHKKTLNERMGGYSHMVFMSKDAEKQFNEASEDVKKSIFNLLRESAEEATKKITMESLIECVKELQDRVLELEAKRAEHDKDLCECCKEKADRVHLMVHLLLPILNSDHPIVGHAAMSMLLASKAQDAKISKEAFLQKMSAQWDELIAADPNNSDDDDEGDDE